MAEDLSVPLLMFIAHRAAESRIFSVVRQAGFDRMTQAQGRLTAGIDPEGTRLSVLADRAQVAKQTATALVDKLEKAGYVERVPDPSDGRARLVRLTPLGMSFVPVARAEERRIEEEWTAYLGPELMEHLREALTLLREITDPYAPRAEGEAASGSEGSG